MIEQRMTIPTTTIQESDIGQVEGSLDELPHLQLSYAINKKFGGDTFSDLYMRTLEKLFPNSPVTNEQEAVTHNYMRDHAIQASTLEEYIQSLGI